jgi:hypothetical protein
LRQGVPQDGAKLWHDTNYAEKVKNTTTEGIKLLEGRATEPEMKKLRVEAPGEDKGPGEGGKTVTS